MTVEQYLELDRDAEVHSEYYDGEMFPVGTSGIRHGEIQGNVYGSLRTCSKGSPVAHS